MEIQYLRMAVWQMLQLSCIVYCLISPTWIVAKNGSRSQGLFTECRTENLSCTDSSNCSMCDGNIRLTCKKLTNKTQGADKEIAGGLLITSSIGRLLATVVLVGWCFLDGNTAKDLKPALPRYITIFEELAGVFDTGIAGLYLFVNNKYVADHQCAIFGLAFWLNFIRPISAFAFIRILMPLMQSVSQPTEMNELLRIKKSKDDRTSIDSSENGMKEDEYKAFEEIATSQRSCID